MSVPENLTGINFLTVEFTQYLPAPANTYYIVVGADDGSLIVYDQSKQQFIDLGTRGIVIDGQIGCISIKNNSIVIASSMGQVAHYPLIGSSMQPSDPDMIDFHNVESAVVAIHMDDMNNEGLIGTEAGCIHYVNFSDKMIVPLV